MKARFRISIVTLLVAIPGVVSGAETPSSGSGQTDGRGYPTLFVRGCAGLTFQGFNLCASAGPGWVWDTAEVGLLGGYSRDRTEDIILGPGERWIEARSFEAVLWGAVRPLSRLRLGGTASVGYGRVVLRDLDERTYSRRSMTWMMSAGPGFGPAFLLLGLSGPDISIRNALGMSFSRSLVVYLSLNVTADIRALLEWLKPDAK